MRRAVAAVVVLAVLAGAAAGCGGNPRATPETTVPPPVVDGDPSAFASVEVQAKGSTTALPAELIGGVAPLVTAKALGRRADLAEFGLDTPTARLVYRTADGREVSVWVGDPTFDNRGVYVMRNGSDEVFMALAEPLRPVLALVGVTVPPPA